MYTRPLLSLYGFCFSLELLMPTHIVSLVLPVPYVLLTVQVAPHYWCPSL
jgi:hypothetical protein